MKAYGDNSWWYSKLQDASTCLAYYKLKHLDKLPIESRSLDAECGTALHIGIADILSGSSDGVEIAMLYWDTVKYEDLTRFKYGWKDLQFCLKEWLRKFKKSHAKNFEVLRVEERLYSKVKEHSAEGTPDFLGYYKGSPSVGDWKTTTNRYDPRQIIAEGQMVSYAHYAKQQLGFYAQQTLYIPFVKSFTAPSIQTPIIRMLTNDAIDSIICNMDAQINDLKARTVFYRNTHACIRGPIVCAAFEICHGKQEVKEE